MSLASVRRVFASCFPPFDLMLILRSIQIMKAGGVCVLSPHLLCDVSMWVLRFTAFEYVFTDDVDNRPKGDTTAILGLALSA